MILAQQLELVTKYVASYATLDEAGALALVNGSLERDAKAAAYRIKWFPEFQKILPGKLAAKFMQIDRRLGTITQMQIISQVPVIP